MLVKLRKHLTYANVVSTLVAVHVVIALGCGATTASAAAAKSARFKGELSGTQFNKTDLSDAEGCQGPGTSTERIEFQSTTFRLLFTELPPSEIVLGRTGTVRIPVNGTVTRSNEGSAACLNAPNVPSDCGTRPLGNWTLELQWKTRGFYLLGQIYGDVFSNCSSQVLYHPFPGLFGATIGQPQVVARASIRQLLNRRKRRIVAVGKGSASEGGAAVNLDYRLTFTRVKQRRGRR